MTGDGSGGDGSDGSGGDGSDGSGGSCVDMDATCTHWASIGYCVEGHQYQPYMHETCKLSCGLCSTSAPTSAPTGACKDSDSNCWGWAEAGYCDASSQYSAWMGENCKLSCGSCGGGGGGGSSGSSGGGACGDDDSHCSHWASIGYCEDSSVYSGYMKGNCRLSCGVCR